MSAENVEKPAGTKSGYIMDRLYGAGLALMAAGACITEILPSAASATAPVISLGITAFLVGALVQNRGLYLWLPVVLLAVGHGVLLSSGFHPEDWYRHITSTLVLPVLFVFLPAATRPMRKGPWFGRARRWVAVRSDCPDRIFPVLAVFQIILGTMLTIGSVPVMEDIMRDGGMDRYRRIRLYTAAYAATMLVNPFDGLVNMSLGFGGIAYTRYAPLGLVTGGLLILGSWAFSGIGVPRLRSQHCRNKSPRTSDNGSLTGPFLYIAVLVVLTVAAVDRLPVSAPVYGIIAILASSSLVIVFKEVGAGGFSGKEFIADWRGQVRGYRGFLPFLLAAGFFGSVLTESGLRDIMGGFLAALDVPGYFRIQILIALTVACGLVGIHMLVPFTAITAILTPSAMNLSEPAFVLFLLGCWVNAMIVSPFAPFTAVVAESTGTGPFQVARRNTITALVLFLTLPGIILGFSALTGPG